MHLTAEQGLGLAWILHTVGQDCLLSGAQRDSFNRSPWLHDRGSHRRRRRHRHHHFARTPQEAYGAVDGPGMREIIGIGQNGLHDVDMTLDIGEAATRGNGNVP